MFTLASKKKSSSVKKANSPTGQSAASKKKSDAKQSLNRIKMEAASEVGVNLKSDYNGDLTSRQAGSIGGMMVKKMVSSYKNGKGSSSSK